MTSIFLDIFDGTSPVRPICTRTVESGISVSLGGNVRLTNPLNAGAAFESAINYTGISPALAIPVGSVIKVTWVRNNTTAFFDSTGANRTSATIAFYSADSPPLTARLGVFNYNDTTMAVTEGLVTTSASGPYTAFSLQLIVANSQTSAGPTVANAPFITALEITLAPDVICVSADTSLITAAGPRRACDLAEGDLVSVRRYSDIVSGKAAGTTKDYLPIAQIVKQEIAAQVVRFPIGSMGESVPAQEALITAPHPILMEDRKVFTEAGLFVKDPSQRPAPGADAEGEPEFVPYHGSIFNLVFAEECAYEVAGGLFLAAELPVLGTVRDRLARTYLEGFEWRVMVGAPLRQRLRTTSDWYREDEPEAA